jgi:hypothetical protein
MGACAPKPQCSKSADEGQSLQLSVFQPVRDVVEKDAVTAPPIYRMENGEIDAAQV